MARNKFKAAINHIKSTQIDEKIQRLNEAPTNSMSGVYDLSPQGQRYGEKNPEKTFYANADGSWPPGVPGTPGERTYIRPRGYWEEGPGTTPSVQHDNIVNLDFSYSTQIDDPRNTKTLIDETTGRVQTELPPNSRSFILGPLVDLYFHNHGYDNRTYVGYIQKDTRSFVLLGYVIGTWGDDDSGNPIRADGFEGSINTRVWNGLESSFVATNPNFTFEMLQWHHERLKEGKYVKNVSFFNSGGVPIITGAGGSGQPSGSTQGNVSGTPTGGDAAGGADANQTHGSGGNPTTGTPQDDPINGSQEDAGFPWGLWNKFKEKIGDLLNKFGTRIPALDYATNIAKSILANEPLIINQNDIPPATIQKLADGIDPNMIGTMVPVTSEPIPYSDENFYEDSNGKIHEHTPSTLKEYPNNTGPVTFKDPGYAGLGNPLAAAGQAQMQVIVPSSGEPYLLYTDHAYHNVTSNDPGEVPDPIKSALSDLVHNVAGYGTYEQPPEGVPDVNLGTGRQYTGIDATTPNTGAMSGYPPNIRGDVRTEVVIPISQLPPDVQRKIGDVRKNVGGIWNDNPINNQVKESYILTESRKRILREIKQPISEVSEIKPQKLKKYRPNFKGRFTAQNTPDVTACKESDNMVRAKNAAGQTWRRADKYWGGYESAERLNVIYDHVGHGQLYWDEIVAHNQGKKGVRNRDVQEELNKHYALLAERKIIEELGLNEQETLEAPNDPLLKRVMGKLKYKIDYPDKPSKAGYPNENPMPDMGGFHPEYGKRANYYNALDPKSADAMPPTGDPETDEKVASQKTKSTLLGKINRRRKNA